jgi:hypothetical protein
VDIHRFKSGCLNKFQYQDIKEIASSFWGISEIIPDDEMAKECG